MLLVPRFAWDPTPETCQVRGNDNVRRTHRECAKRGWTSQTIECYNAVTQRSRDLYGFADVLAVDARPRAGGIYAIQVTSYSNMAARKRKILAEAKARHWLVAGGRILLHGWKRTTRGKRVRYVLTEREITLDDFKGKGSSRAKRAKPRKRAAGRKGSRRAGG